MESSHSGLVLKCGLGTFQNRSTSVRGVVKKIFSKKLFVTYVGKFINKAESSHSGLVRSLGKRVGKKFPQEFKSPTLRFVYKV